MLMEPVLRELIRKLNSDRIKLRLIQQSYISESLVSSSSYVLNYMRVILSYPKMGHCSKHSFLNLQAQEPLLKDIQLINFYYKSIYMCKYRLIL